MKKIWALILVAALALGLCACGGGRVADNATFEGIDVNIAVLSGPTGVGAVETNIPQSRGRIFNFTFSTPVSAPHSAPTAAAAATASAPLTPCVTKMPYTTAPER